MARKPSAVSSVKTKAGDWSVTCWPATVIEQVLAEGSAPLIGSAALARPIENARQVRSFM
jgi:hypothetical protein